MSKDDFAYTSDGKRVYCACAIYETGLATNLTVIAFMVSAENADEAQGKVHRIAKEIMQQVKSLTHLKHAEISNSQIVCSPGLTSWKG